MTKSYAEYVAGFVDPEAEMVRGWFGQGGEPMLTEEEFYASEARVAEASHLEEKARIARLASVGHGPSDIVMVRGLPCLLRDVRRDYEDQPPRFWKMMAEAHGRIASEEDWMWRSYGLIDKSEPT